MPGVLQPHRRGFLVTCTCSLLYLSPAAIAHSLDPRASELEPGPRGRGRGARSPEKAANSECPVCVPWVIVL